MSYKKPILLASALLSLLLASCTPPEPVVQDTGERFERLRRERIEAFLLEALRTNNVDLWLVVTRENNPDPLAADLAAENAVLPAALLFEVREGALHTRAICANFDVDPFRASGIYQQVSSYGSEGLLPHLREAVQAIDPQRIAVNVS